MLKNKQKVFNEKSAVEPLNVITGIILLVAGALYIINNRNAAIFIASIGLLIEAARNIIK